MARDALVGSDHAVQHAIQCARSSNAAILAFEGAGCGVSGVCKQWLFFSRLLGVEGVEALPREVDFAADLQRIWRAFAEHQRNGSDGAHIGRNVFAYTAIPSRQRPRQAARLVMQRNRHAIVFQLHHKLHLLALQDLIDSGGPFRNVLRIVGIGQRKHGLAVGNLFKAIGDVPSYTLGRRIGIVPFGVHILCFLQTHKQSIELPVRNLWCCVDVVHAVVRMQLLT